MMYLRPWALGALLVFFPIPAVTDELQDIRQQIETLQQEYEARIRALEERLNTAEQEAAAARSQAEEAERTATAAMAAPAPEPAAAEQEKANTFNPAVSLILQGSLNSYSLDPDGYALPGFQLGGEAGLSQLARGAFASLARRLKQDERSQRGRDPSFENPGLV